MGIWSCIDHKKFLVIHDNSISKYLSIKDFFIHTYAGFMRRLAWASAHNILYLASFITQELVERENISVNGCQNFSLLSVRSDGKGYCGLSLRKRRNLIR